MNMVKTDIGTIQEQAAELLCGELMRMSDTINLFTAAKGFSPCTYRENDTILYLDGDRYAVRYDALTRIHSVKMVWEEEGDTYITSYKALDSVTYTVSLDNVCLYDTESGEDISLKKGLVKFLFEGIRGEWNYEC